MTTSHAGSSRKKVILFLGIVIIGGLLFIYLSRNTLARRCIEHGAEYAFGVPASVGSVNIDITDPSIQIRNLDTANPAEFSDKSFFKLDYSDASLDAKSILNRPITIPEMTFSGITLFLEMKGSKSNVTVVLENLKQIRGNKPRARSRNRTNTEFIVEKLDLYDIGIHAQITPVSGLAATGDLVIDHIRLTDLGKNGTGVRMEEILGIALQAILSSTVQMRGSGIPADLIAHLTDSMTDLPALQTQGIALTTETTKRMKAVVDSTMKGFQDSMPNPDELREDIEGLGRGLLKSVEQNEDADST